MDRSWVHLPRDHDQHKYGCIEFLQFLKIHEDVSGVLHYPCPCRNCRCQTLTIYRTRNGIANHLCLFGFWEFYTNWTSHGEAPNVCYPSMFHRSRDEAGPSNSEGSVDPSYIDPTMTLLNEVFPYGRMHVPTDGNVVDDNNTIPDLGNNDPNEVDKYNRLLAHHQTPLYEGSNETVLGTIMELMEAKVKYKMSIAAFDENLDIWKRKLEQPNNLPENHDKVRRILKDIGLGYTKIHACRYDCCLFYGPENKDREVCPKCGTPRYKVMKSSGKKIPAKVVYYFPLRYRLQRMFMSSHTAKDMRWHKERTVPPDDILRHPSDGEE